jgi:hypothetical protein
MGDALHFDKPQEGVPEDESGMRHLKIDVYAFGVTLWEMLMRQRPHGDLHAFQIQVRSPATAYSAPTIGPVTASVVAFRGSPQHCRQLGGPSIGSCLHCLQFIGAPTYAAGHGAAKP